MKINDLIAEQKTDEGIGSALAAGARGLAKGAGAAVGGLAGMGSAFKQGYTGGKLAVAGGAPAAQGGDSSSIQQQIAQKQAEIAALKKQLGTPPVEPGIGNQQNPVAAVASNTPEPGQAAAPQAPAEPPPVEPGIGANQNQVKATASNTPKPAALSPAQVRKQKQAAAAKVAQDQMAANPAPAPAPSPADAAAQTRQEKQAAAAATAQQQMAANPAPAAGPKTIDNPVATVGTRRATNVGQPTFDTQTGKALPGQAMNAIRKRAEYGTGALGAARKRMQGGGTVAGQVSQTPNAVRKREARAAERDWNQMATGMNEGAEFYSRFLGKNI